MITHNNDTPMMEDEQMIFENRRILIVEDDPFISKVYMKRLIHFGAEVQFVNNGAQALAELQKQPYDLVMLDLGMPGMDGFETLMHIRANQATAHVPVLILSNTTMDEGREGYKEIIEAGVEGVFRKYETSLRDLTNIIKEIFAKSSKLKATN